MRWRSASMSRAAAGEHRLERGACAALSVGNKRSRTRLERTPGAVLDVGVDGGGEVDGGHGGGRGTGWSRMVVFTSQALL